MKVWYQIWLPPTETRLEAKVFGIRATDGIIDRAGFEYSALVGRSHETVSEAYKSKGAIVSEIAQETY